MQRISDKINLPSLSRRRFENAHRVEINGKVVEPVPYLTLPFLSSDVRSYDITEGWRYSRNEHAIHGHRGHAGIDFAVPYGTPVVAPCSGFAISSYFSFPILEDSKELKLLDGKPIYFGLGYFVQIYNPEVQRFFQLGHLADIDPDIPFSLPVYESSADRWSPTKHDLLISEILNPRNANVVLVETGQPLGSVGYSGLRWGYDDYEEGSKRPVVIDPVGRVSWDEPHLHTSDYYRKNDGTRAPFAWRDGLSNYLTWSRYPTPNRQGKDTFIGPEPLYFISEETGLPIFADEI